MPPLSLLTRLSACLGGLCLFSCSPIQSKDENFLSDYSGLQQKKKLDDRIVYEGGVARLANYDKILLEEVTVFPPEKAKKRKVKQEDLWRIRNLFQEALEKEIIASRADLATEPGPRTVALRAAIYDLQPGKPAVFAMGYAPYVGVASTATKAVTGLNMGAGSATIEMELVDSVTREQLFAIVDEAVGSKLQIAKGMSRWGHIEAALKKWSENLRKTLKESMEMAAQSGS